MVRQYLATVDRARSPFPECKNLVCGTVNTLYHCGTDVYQQLIGLSSITKEVGVSHTVELWWTQRNFLLGVAYLLSIPNHVSINIPVRLQSLTLHDVQL